MREDEVDGLLDGLLEQHFNAAEDQLRPSSGFLQEVMSAVERDAAAPERLRFPWGRALVGMVCVIAVLCVGAAYVATHTMQMAVPAGSVRVFVAGASAGDVRDGLAWSGLAALLSLGTMAAAWRAVGRAI